LYDGWQFFKEKPTFGQSAKSLTPPLMPKTVNGHNTILLYYKSDMKNYFDFPWILSSV